MKIIYKTGDLLVASESIICHGCNAQGKMGKGVAKQIREQEPSAYKAYMKVHEDTGLALGSIIWAEGRRHTIINAITQDRYRPTYASDGVQYANYEAIRSVIQKINEATTEAVAFPLIGAGLAGGSWKVISQIIEDESTRFQPVVYLFDGVVPVS